jgi:hypothetical protein
VNGRQCTCAGTAPGFPQHETGCDLRRVPIVAPARPKPCPRDCADEWHMHPVRAA